MDVQQEQGRAAVEIPSEAALIVFIKNPVLGKVKTRLAATIGEKKALAVYEYLLHHTFEVSKEIEVSRHVFYSGFIPDQDEWQLNGFCPELQHGEDLGERMQNAFQLLFRKGFRKIVIIGSDCIELSAEVLRDAFDQLKEKDVVIGPANDGGYYLLGMNTMYKVLFHNKKWSTETVFQETIKDCKENHLNVATLPILIDIDTNEDWELFSSKSKKGHAEMIFVYNADSGLFNSLTDFAHKIISPSTYDCQLCAITYGNFTTKKEWKTFIENLDIKTEFYYKDEFIKTFRSVPSLNPPAVYIQEDERIELFISSAEINALGTLDELQRMITVRLMDFKGGKK